jgi:hypothetical protein
MESDICQISGIKLKTINDWRSIKDNPPNENGRYLVYESFYNRIVISTYKDGNFLDIHAIYWHPLPNPPDIE